MKKYDVYPVQEYREKFFKTQVEFCQAVSLHKQRFTQLKNSHYVLVDPEGVEKPVLFLKGKEVEITETPVAKE